MNKKQLLTFTLLSIGIIFTTVGQIIISPPTLYGASTSCNEAEVSPWRRCSQTDPPANNHINVCDDYDRLGIGTSVPQAKLHVNGSTIINRNLTINKDLTVNGIVKHGLYISRDSDNETDRLLTLEHNASFGGLHNKWSYRVNTSGALFLESHKTNAAYLINPTGSVGIGTDCIPGGSKLAVGGKIICEEVEVKLKGTNCWADYVFAKNYQLKPLAEVEDYINKNKHLPGVPKTEEIVEEGLSVAEMLKIQMEKIEELTLYVIELKKENEQQQQVIDNLTSKK